MKTLARVVVAGAAILVIYLAAAHSQSAACPCRGDVPVTEQEFRAANSAGNVSGSDGR